MPTTKKRPRCFVCGRRSLVDYLRPHRFGRYKYPQTTAWICRFSSLCNDDWERSAKRANIKIKKSSLGGPYIE